MLTQTVEYALRATVRLAEMYGAPQTTRQLAETTQVPPDYLAKVLQGLTRAGLLHAARGKRGGFELVRPPTAISVLEIVEAVDPLGRIRTCPLGLAAHRDALCPLHAKLDAALAQMEEAFATSCLADMVDRRGALCAMDSPVLVGIRAGGDA